MKISFITLFPELIEGVLAKGVVGQALAQGKVQVQYINPRQFTQDIHHTVDDRPFGGGDGMVMLAEPLYQAVQAAKSIEKSIEKCIEKCIELKTRIIAMSPQGEPLKQVKVQQLLHDYGHLVFVCGRYAGIDQRFLDTCVDEQISIGDYILSGGELPALVLADAIIRQVDGVLGHEASAVEDTFSMPSIFEAPLYTRPRDWRGQLAPEALLSGHHKRLTEYRFAAGLNAAKNCRPELVEAALKAGKLSQKDLERAQEILRKESIS